MALIAGFHGFDFIGQNETIVILAEIGVVLLLFEVGLESNIHEMLSVGPSSLLVALLGCAAMGFLAGLAMAGQFGQSQSHDIQGPVQELSGGEAAGGNLDVAV